MKHTVVFSLSALILLGAVVPRLYSQASGARVDGFVNDAQGLPMPGVEVTLKETGTGLGRTTATSSAGTYQFPSLNPGHYELVAKSKGFAPEVREVTLEINQALHLDLSLKLGEVSQAVEVVDSAQMLRTADASLGEVVETTLTQQLPLNGRQLLDLPQPAASSMIEMGAGSAGSADYGVDIFEVRPVS